MRERRAGTFPTAVLVAGAVFAATVLVAAQGQDPAPKVVVTDYDMKKAAAPTALSEPELAGKRTFVQRCALCHDLLGQPSATTVGPWVDRETVKARGEQVIGDQIRNGSRRMPGWRHTLTAPQVDQVIAYLKTVTPEQRPRPPAQVVVPTD